MREMKWQINVNRRRPFITGLLRPRRWSCVHGSARAERKRKRENERKSKHVRERERKT